MFGTLVTKGRLIQLVNSGTIKITPFDANRAQAAHYPLEGSIIYRRVGDEWKPAHDLRTNNEFIFEQSEYCLIEVAQSISMVSGYSGQFIPASNLVEQGFALVAGKISYPFGTKQEKVRFGIKNLLASRNKLHTTDRLAYLQLFDYSALAHISYDLDERDIRVFLTRFRRADDDGPNYDKDIKPNDSVL